MWCRRDLLYVNPVSTPTKATATAVRYPYIHIPRKLVTPLPPSPWCSYYACSLVTRRPEFLLRFPRAASLARLPRTNSGQAIILLFVSSWVSLQLLFLRTEVKASLEVVVGARN